MVNMVDFGVAKSVDPTQWSTGSSSSWGFAKTRPDEEQGTDTKAEACHLCWLLLVGTERSYSTEIPMVLSIVYVWLCVWFVVREEWIMMN
jgi:hypothetical protein